MSDNPTFKVLAAKDVPKGLATLVASSVHPQGFLFGIPVAVSENVPQGEVWVFDGKLEPTAKLSDIKTIHDTLSCTVVFREPLRRICCTVLVDKEP